MARSSQARKEYSRLRSIARKRIDRLQRAGVWSSERANKERLKLLTPTRYVSESDLPIGIQDLQNFLYRRPTTLPAARQAKKRKEESVRKAARKLNERWGLGISDEDMDTFGKYMEWLRKRAVNEIFDSSGAVYDLEKIRESADAIPGVDVSSVLKDFKYWTEHQDDLTEAKQIPKEFFRRPRGKDGKQTSRQLRNALARFVNS